MTVLPYECRRIADLEVQKPEHCEPLKGSVRLCTGCQGPVCKGNGNQYAKEQENTVSESYECCECDKSFKPYKLGKQTITTVCNKCVRNKAVSTLKGNTPIKAERVYLSKTRILLDFTRAPLVIEYLQALYPGKDIAQAMTEEIARSAKDWLHERMVLEPMGLKDRE